MRLRLGIEQISGNGDIPPAVGIALVVALGIGDHVGAVLGLRPSHMEGATEVERRGDPVRAIGVACDDPQLATLLGVARVLHELVGSAIPSRLEVLPTRDALDGHIPAARVRDVPALVIGDLCRVKDDGGTVGGGLALHVNRVRGIKPARDGIAAINDVAGMARRIRIGLGHR